MTHEPLDPTRASARFLDAIPYQFAREHLVLSQGRALGADEESERLAISDTIDPLVVHNVAVRLRRSVVSLAVDAEQLATAIDAAYEQHTSQQQVGMGTVAVAAVDSLETAPEQGLDALLQRAERDLLASGGKAPVVQLVDRLVFDAVTAGASDLHLQPLPDAVVIRRRVDGALDDGQRIAVGLLRPVVSRIKVMARMDVAERLIPQDGRATVAIGERTIDLRVSTLPTPHGERVVIRLLDAGRALQRFSDLGMPEAVRDDFLGAARRTSGIVLVTGPTGSGKTTTLYATLRELDARERNIMTIEDPIEYELDTLGLPISQSQVNTRKGVTFANGLRHILRQDPDVVLVGEIRDAETARVAIQASLTGHLVFSTLHTNDAVTAVTRLVDLGVEPYLVAASLTAVLAQRLVRLHCDDCGGSGCAQCHHTGYRGRGGLFELIAVDDAFRAAISDGAALDHLRQLAAAGGTTSLAAAGQDLIAAGRTSQAEVERVVHG